MKFARPASFMKTGKLVAWWIVTSGASMDRATALFHPIKDAYLRGLANLRPSNRWHFYEHSNATPKWSTIL